MDLTKAEKEFHRKIAADCFNSAWDLLVKEERSSSEEIKMIYLANSSLYHWSLVGTPRNIAISQWQVSRVYAEIGEAPLALRFAEACKDTVGSSGLVDLSPSVHEGLARAYAAGRQFGKAKAQLSKARAALDRFVKGKADRETYDKQIAETEALVRRLQAKARPTGPSTP